MVANFGVEVAEITGLFKNLGNWLFPERKFARIIGPLGGGKVAFCQLDVPTSIRFCLKVEFDVQI